MTPAPSDVGGRVARLGEPVPAFALVRLDGARVTPESLRGRAVLLVFLRHLL